MATGTVKWFNARKGYGFIAPDEGDKDVFVHITEVQNSGLPGLAEGQRISFEVMDEPKGLKAVGLEAVEA
jgi:CspA family cold shock protein